MIARMRKRVAWAPCRLVNEALPRLAAQHVAAEPRALAILVTAHPCRIGPVRTVVPPVVVAVGRPAAVVVERPFAAVPVHHHVGSAEIAAVTTVAIAVPPVEAG